MKRSIFYFSIFLYISGIISCRKHKDKTGESDQLLKVVLVDSVKPAKSVRVYDFIYDNNNRVTAISYSAGDSVNGGLELRSYRSSTCTYIGTEKTASLTTGFLFSAGPPNAQIFHFYNNGVLQKDSLPDWRTNDKTGYYYYNRDYSYRNNSVIIKSTNALTSPNFPEIYYDSIGISNHNITSRYSLYYPGNPFLQGHQYVYDNKINPLSRLNISNFLIGNDVEYSLTPGYSNNNVTRWESGYLNNGQWTAVSVFNLSYTYNDKGLPVECKVSGAPLPYTIKYFYK